MHAETDLSVAYNSKAIQLYYLIVQATTTTTTNYNYYYTYLSHCMLSHKCQRADRTPQIQFTDRKTKVQY